MIRILRFAIPVWNTSDDEAERDNEVNRQEDRRKRLVADESRFWRLRVEKVRCGIVES